MTFCPKCGEKVEEESDFCQSCGALIEKKMTVEAIPQKGLMSRIEQTIYFRIARGFAWLILFIVTISLVIYTINLAPTALELVGGETRVSQDDIKRAIAAEKARRPFMFEETVPEKIDPELMAKLDKEIYELFNLMPQDMQRPLNIEGFRNYVKNSVTYIARIQDRIALIKEARDIIKDFPVAERMEAIGKFFEIKAQKEMAVKNKKEAAKQRLRENVIYILSGIIFITLLSMILVLLAVERNTRKGIER